MAESATARIAAKLKARQERAQSVPPAEVADTEETTAPAEDTEDEALLPGGDDVKPISMKDRAAAARAARKGKAAPEPVEAEDEDEDEDDEEEAEAEPVVVKAAKKPAAKATPIKGKKAHAASPAQIAAREAFAARSRAAAAAKRGEPTPAPVAVKGKGKPATKAGPVQTEADVRRKQSEARAAARAAAEEAVKPRNTPTSKAVVVQKPSKAAAARIAKADKAAEKAAKVRPSAKTKGAAKEPSSDSKAKVLAMWAKGSSRRQIAEALDLSYAAVFYHTKNTPGTGAGAKGKIFVDSPLNEDGAKIGRGKTERVSRSEAMRRFYLSGHTVGESAKEYGVVYQIAYTAIRSLLADAAEAE